MVILLINYVDNEEQKALAQLFSALNEKGQQIILYMQVHGTSIRPVQLAAALDLPHSTVNSVLKRLQAHGLVNWGLYKEATLSDAGKIMAIHQLQHHTIVHNFLERYLGIPTEIAHTDGLNAAQLLSCVTIQRMQSMIHGSETLECNLFEEDLS